MLIKIRTLGGKWVLGFFMVFVTAAFGLWGIGDMLRPPSMMTVASVGDVEITDRELSRAFRREIALLQPRFNNRLDSALARDLGVLDSTIESLLTRILYDLEGARLGLMVSDAMILNEIKATPTFQNVDGNFDPDLFASTLASNQLSEPQYVARLRDGLRRTQLLDSITGPANVPKVLLDSLYRYREERRVADYFVVSRESASDIPEPDGTALAAFHRDNARLFTAPEYRRLSFIHITPEDILGETAVSDEEIETEYDDRQAEFLTPATRTLEQIILPGEATARRAHGMLQQGRDFAAVADDFAGTAGDALSLGEVTREDLFGDAIADAVFALAEGEYSAPIESPFGWHLFRVVAASEEAMRPLAAVRDQLEREIAMRQAADLLYDFANRLDDTLAGGATIEAAASALRLSLDRIGAVDARGLTRGGGAAERLPAGPEFLSTAFALGDGETSLLVEAGDGSAFVVRLDAVIAPALKPLDTIRDEVEAAWRAEQRDTAAKLSAEQAAERVNSGESFALVAADLGLAAARTAPIRRDGDGGDLAAPLVLDLFGLRKREAVSGPDNEATGYAVLRLVEIVDARPGADEDATAGQREELRASIAAGIIDQFRGQLEKRYPVQVNQGAIDALF